MDKFVVILILVCIFLFLALLSATIFIRKEKKSREELEYLVDHDTVTGHTNWNWMWKQIGQRTGDKEIPYDFVHFDIKNFKMYNEIYDHHVGDEVLRFVSRKIMEQDFVLYSAKCHNDNFAFVTKPNTEDLKEKLEKMFEEMNVMPGLEEFPMYFRCGVVERNKLLRVQDSVADMAKMAQATGRKLNCNEIIFYDDEMKNVLIQGEKLKAELPEAILRDEILVYFQPKFDSKLEKIAGAEALVRWNYHGNTIMFPGDFVPHLEKNNAIGMLDEHVTEKVCQYLDKWGKEGKNLYPVSINLSQKELSKPTIVEDLESIVNKYDIDRKFIEFEVTETALTDDKSYILEVMNRLRSVGFSLSMDDFGTGYSSFNLLKDMPLNTLKIDKSFVDSIGKPNDERGEMIVEDIVNMAKHLEIKCVAEGVEEENQKDALKSWGCDLIQGYYYSKPMPVDEFEKNYL